MGTDGGVGAGCMGAGAEVGVAGSAAAGKGDGRRILNFRNMKATELWKLVLGVASVATGTPGASVTTFFRPDRPETVFPTSGMSTVAVGLVCTVGLGTLMGAASAMGFFTLKSKATSSRSEQQGSGDPSWAVKVPLQSLSCLSLVAGADSGSAVASGVCTSK